MGPFDREACFPDLRRIGGGDARELRSDVVDDVEVAVGTVVVAQSEIGAHRLGIRRVHLHETRKCQKAIERVVALQARQHDREITAGQRQSKTVPGFGCGDGEFCRGAVVRTDAEFIQRSAVVATEALEEVVGEFSVLP